MTMATYTFIANYKGGVSVHPVNARSILQACRVWAKGIIEFKYIPNLDISKFSKSFRDDMEDLPPVPLRDISNVWGMSISSGRNFMLVNIIKTYTRKIETQPLARTNQYHIKHRKATNGTNYTFILYYRGGTYIEQISASDVLKATYIWAERTANDPQVENLNRQDFQKAFDKAIGEFPTSLGNTRRNSWHLFFFSSRNRMDVHIVKTSDEKEPLVLQKKAGSFLEAI